MITVYFNNSEGLLDVVSGKLFDISVDRVVVAGDDGILHRIGFGVIETLECEA